MAARKRGNSTLVLRQKTAPTKPAAPIIPKSTYTTDPFLTAFLSPTFDAANFLNTTLPPLKTGSSAPKNAVPLSELSNDAQSLASQLNSHTTRLSTTLTQLTDDILRSGSRLAYEVELLRGETLGFAETLNETLQDDIKKFVPEGVDSNTVVPPRPTSTIDAVPPSATGEPKPPAVATTPADDIIGPDDPECIRQLQMLTTVRGRLESVIKTFGDAMEFVFPPSELSMSSSFLSVSAPEPGSKETSSEQKGQQVLGQVREEIKTLLADTQDPIGGIERALQRIEELKELNVVWKGTAEEKGRLKFIESLAKMVEDKHEQLLKEVEAKQVAERAAKATKTVAAAAAAAENTGQETTQTTGFGFMSQLQKIREAVKQ